MDLITDILLGFWNTLGEMAPYLLFGFFLAALLSMFVSPRLVERHLGGRGIWPVLKASVIGVPLPLCSCGVIPVAASLHRQGSSNGATTAFLISTPQTGVDSILVTYGLLGPVMAIFRPVAAFISGVVGGWIVDRTDSGNPAHAPTDSCADSCETATATGQSRFMAAMRHGLITLPTDIAKPLMVGLLIAGLIDALLPEQFLPAFLGSGILAMLFMMAIGIPMYVCATASVPIAAAMMMKGVSPGAALVFLMTGPATNAAAIAIIWKMMGPRATFAYLGSIAGTALISGLLLDWLFQYRELPATQMAHSMLPDGIKTVSAVALLLLLAVGFSGKSRRSARTPKTGGDRSATVLSISGMTCQHCANSVRRAICAASGTERVTVDVHNGTATLQGRDHPLDAVIRAVEALGYGANLQKGVPKD